MNSLALSLGFSGGVVIPGTAAWRNAVETLSGVGGQLGIPNYSGTILGWWDAAFVTSGSGTVSAIADLTANGNTAVQATSGKQPTLNVSDAAFNNEPTLGYVAASQQNLVTPALSWTQAITYYIVGSVPSAPAGIQSFIDSPSSSNYNCVYCTTAGDMNVYAGTNLAGTAVVTSPCVMCAVFNGASSAIYVNDHATANPSGNAGASNPSAGITIGGNNKIANFLTGTIGCVIAASGADSAANRLAVFTFLGTRYNIAVS